MVSCGAPIAQNERAQTGAIVVDVAAKGWVATMKYRVVGQNKDTGARMSLEFEAESKAAAERKALGAGMTVNHVTDITDGHDGGVTPGDNPAYRGPVKTGGGGLIKLVLLVVILAAIAYLFRDQIRGLMNR